MSSLKRLVGHRVEVRVWGGSWIPGLLMGVGPGEAEVWDEELGFTLLIENPRFIREIN